MSEAGIPGNAGPGLDGLAARGKLPAAQGIARWNFGLPQTVQAQSELHGRALRA